MEIIRPPELKTDRAHTILDSFEEAQLLEEVAQGSIPAFTRLFNVYLPLMHQYIAKFLDFHQPDIEEVAQDTFLKIWKKKEVLVTIRSFEKYLYVVGRNTLLDFYRSKKSHLSKRTADQYFTIPNYPADEKIINDEYLTLAKEALELLPEKRKLVFELRTQEELTLEEIASKTNLSIAGVHQNLQKAVTFIRDYLRERGLEVGSVLIFWLLMPK